MSSKMGRQGEVRIPMPQIEAPDFITAERAKLELAFHEAKRQASGSFIPNPLIQRVPPVLLDIKQNFKKCFEPRLVAFGPLHHDNPKFEQSEHRKRKLAALFAEENGKSGEVLFELIKETIKDLRKCYDPKDIQHYDDDKLAWMFFVDGCAVLYSIYCGLRGEYKKLNTKADLLVFSQRDMFLLENQLPYRVIQILIDSTTDPQKWEKSISEFIAQNLMTTIADEPETTLKEEKQEKQEYTHLLDRLRRKLLVGNKEKNPSNFIGNLILSRGVKRKHRKTFRSIKELKESGIKVKPNKTNSSLRNITFQCKFYGRLNMPRILVDDSTSSKFLNLVAFEMCGDFENDFEVTTYLCFLDSLINTADDVKELRVSGMLHNYLGSDEEVANLFNQMSRDLVPDQGMYDDVTEDILKYCNNPWPAAMAQAYYTYFSSPWTFLALLAAVLGLLFSAVQAYHSFPRDHKPM